MKTKRIRVAGGFERLACSGDELRDFSTRQTAGGDSQSYTLAGELVPLRGLPNGKDYYGRVSDDDDAFVQHHATTYRRLLETLYGYPPTVEQADK